MEFMRNTADYILLDHRISEDIVDPVETKLAQYKEKCLNHVNRIQDICHSKQLPDFRPVQARPGRPIKRLRDGHSCDAETGHSLA